MNWIFYFNELIILHGLTIIIDKFALSLSVYCYKNLYITTQTLIIVKLLMK